jgi:hypothetical protein
LNLPNKMKPSISSSMDSKTNLVISHYNLIY